MFGEIGRTTVLVDEYDEALDFQTAVLEFGVLADRILRRGSGRCSR